MDESFQLFRCKCILSSAIFFEFFKSLFIPDSGDQLLTRLRGLGDMATNQCVVQNYRSKSVFSGKIPHEPKHVLISSHQRKACTESKYFSCNLGQLQIIGVGISKADVSVDGASALHFPCAEILHYVAVSECHTAAARKQQSNAN